jgi:hypothetical protein
MKDTCKAYAPPSMAAKRTTNFGEKHMKVLIASAMIAAGLIVSVTSNAQAPAGSTGECKDGTYTSAESKRGACAGHGGVKTWNSSTAPVKAQAPTMAPASPATAAPAPSPVKGMATPVAATPAAGGGPGQVWVNTKSKVYHCSGDKWYGKTKQGEYMTEAAAKAAGSRADHGKACS